jgi:hypothetical protein
VDTPDLIEACRLLAKREKGRLKSALCLHRARRAASLTRVSKRRQLAILIVLLVTVGLDAAWATPLRAAKEARSAACCARSCVHLRAVTCDSGCCPTRRSPDSPALSAAGKHDSTGSATVGEPAISALATVWVPDRNVVPLAPAGNDPPPIFLLTRTLRL